MSNPLRMPILISTMLLVGCEVGDSRTDSLHNQVSALQRQLGELSHQILMLKLEVNALQRKTVVVDPASPGSGYVAIDTPQGKLLLACDGAEPYLDGHRLKLRIGNPNMITYSGFSLTAKWGPKSPQFPSGSTDTSAASKWLGDYDEWKRMLKQKQMESVQELKPGSWNVAELVLSPSTAREIGYVELSIATNEISLFRDPSR